MKITYYVHDLSFPLAEGIRKQAWWMAKAMREQGHEVEIVSTSKKRGAIVKDGIRIHYGSPLSIGRCVTDVLHHLSHPTPLILPLLLRAKAKKQIMTIFGGSLHGFWERPWDRIVSGAVNKMVSIVTVQTQFQQRLLQKTRLCHLPTEQIPPLIPSCQRVVERNHEPTLLFMSHLTVEKGIEEVLRAFPIVQKKIPGVRLVICDSGIRKSRYPRIIAEMDERSIILKGRVDPIEELSRSWVYLYPIRTARETFSIPLSLIEAAQVGTPFISTPVGGIPEYFPPENLVAPYDYEELAEKIIRLIKKRGLEKDKRSKALFDNEKTIRKHLSLYQL